MCRRVIGVQSDTASQKAAGAYEAGPFQPQDQGSRAQDQFVGGLIVRWMRHVPLHLDRQHRRVDLGCRLPGDLILSRRNKSSVERSKRRAQTT